jgi:hypothetical protein
MRLGAAQCGRGNFTFRVRCNQSGSPNSLFPIFYRIFATTPFQFDAADVKTSNMAEHVRTERPEGTYRKNDKILFMLNVLGTGSDPLRVLICLAS